MMMALPRQHAPIKPAPVVVTYGPGHPLFDSTLHPNQAPQQSTRSRLQPTKTTVPRFVSSRARTQPQPQQQQQPRRTLRHTKQVVPENVFGESVYGFDHVGREAAFGGAAAVPDHESYRYEEEEDREEYGAYGEPLAYEGDETGGFTGEDEDSNYERYEPYESYEEEQEDFPAVQASAKTHGRAGGRKQAPPSAIPTAKKSTPPAKARSGPSTGNISLRKTAASNSTTPTRPPLARAASTPRVGNTSKIPTSPATRRPHAPTSAPRSSKATTPPQHKKQSSIPSHIIPPPPPPVLSPLQTLHQKHAKLTAAYGALPLARVGVSVTRRKEELEGHLAHIEAQIADWQHSGSDAHQNPTGNEETYEQYRTSASAVARKNHPSYQTPQPNSIRRGSSAQVAQGKVYIGKPADMVVTAVPTPWWAGGGTTPGVGGRISLRDGSRPKVAPAASF
ncbi:hypothetical protein DFS34DRAFT_498122 [Phlyctochytrium arcticum]|nr:hypothetical protein DFS34DRAFT_498122 [Phlyctochytrium arcticum]